MLYKSKLAFTSIAYFLVFLPTMQKIKTLVYTWPSKFNPEEITMRKMIVFFALLFTCQVHANTVDSVYKKNTLLPFELQQRILSAVVEKCANVIIPNGIEELSTKVREEQIDQGMLDLYYSTEFASRYYLDDQHPIHAYITVESVAYSIANPAVEPFLIIKVDTRMCENY